MKLISGQCEGRCGEVEICSYSVWWNGYCLKPVIRNKAEKEFGPTKGLDTLKNTKAQQEDVASSGRAYFGASIDLD